MTSWSLRLKLLLAGLAVELVMMALVLGSGLQQLQAELRQQGQQRMEQFVQLAEGLLVPPLQAADGAAVRRGVQQLQRVDGVRYLLLDDAQGQLLAMTGALPAPLPASDGPLATLDIDRPDATWHVVRPLAAGERTVAQLHLGLDTGFVAAARRQMLLRSLPVMAAVLVLTAALLAWVDLLLTRQLLRVERAAERLAGGDYEARAEILSDDDTGRLARAFNTMASSTQQRLRQLQAGEDLQRQQLAELGDGHARLTALFDALDSGVLFIDGQGHVAHVNAAFLRLWRLSATLVAAGRPAEGVAMLLRPQVDEVRGRHRLLAPLAAGALRAQDELRTTDGRLVVQRQLRVPAPGGGPDGRLLLHDDVTAERRVAQQAQRADRDMLTDLLNRRGLHEALTAAVADGGLRGTPLALFFIDLDDFKYTNDTFGHRLGDELLRAVGRALSEELHPGERVARIGGDEFAVLCPGLDAERAAELAPRLVQAVAALQLDARGHELRVGCSVGLALFPDHAPSADSLMVCADLAMYDAKRVGKNGWAAYRHDAERTLSESAQLRWNARITRALDEQRFCLHYQGVHHVDGRVSHYEALLRLPAESDDSVMLSPGDFVPYAERSGRIRPLDRWVLAECIRTLANAPAAVRVAANVSARSLDDRTLADHVDELLKRHGVQPSRLLIEVTETSTIGDPRTAGEMIARLRALGCSVHLDDFGAGFASFAHLKLLAVDGIKIDGSYVRDLLREGESRAFVAAMVAVARALGLTTVAEHVEDQPTLDALRDMGVDLVQGWLFDRPREMDLAAA